MREYETFEYKVCHHEFVAYPDANAARGEYCSPGCESEGKGLN